MVVASKTLDCHHGKDRNIKEKLRYKEKKQNKLNLVCNKFF